MLPFLQLFLDGDQSIIFGLRAEQRGFSTKMHLIMERTQWKNHEQRRIFCNALCNDIPLSGIPMQFHNLHFFSLLFCTILQI